MLRNLEGNRTSIPTQPADEFSIGNLEGNRTSIPTQPADEFSIGNLEGNRTSIPTQPADEFVHRQPRRKPDFYNHTAS
ncbi:hypothetical protein J6590_008581 [Homalodisca vitripennis]|nr:hypothetical protein J6590_008581 [Homalodisca vitripennis]